jgi:hypothetical protein
MKKLSNTIERKFIESYSVNDYEVLTESGWQDISAVHKTILYDKWTVKTTKHELSRGR